MSRGVRALRGDERGGLSVCEGVEAELSKPGDNQGSALEVGVELPDGPVLVQVFEVRILLFTGGPSPR